MKAKVLLPAIVLASAMFVAPSGHADGPIIPPSISKVSPAGMQRGTTATFTVEGRNLAGASHVTFDALGITAKLTAVSDVPEKITGPRAGVDLGAQVPQGKKQTAKLEVTVGKDVEPGLHRFRIQTPLGTSGLGVLAVGALPEVTEQEAASANPSAQPVPVNLPATLWGAIRAPGDTNTYEFEGKAGEELVFEIEGSQLGSELESRLVLRDSSGKLLADAGENSDNPDAVLTYRLPRDGNYTLSVTDREKGGGQDHFYRLTAGPLAYVTGVFPLGVRAGQVAEIAVSGINLGVSKVKIEPAKRADGWTTVPLQLHTVRTPPLNKVKLAVGNEPEVLEREPNGTPAQAQPVSVPVTINGHIGGTNAGGNPDEDYFRFHARQGGRLTIEVAAARLGSPLDSVIEILDDRGNPIPRATVRCLNQTTTTLADRDSRTAGIRLTSTSGIHEGDYLMVGDELDQVASVPDQPDADTMLKEIDGLRVAFLGTSPDVHAVNTPVYKVQVLPPDAEFPPNGLPVFHLTWRNDDGGPGYGADSRLDFVAPKDGDYIVHLKDVRGLQGPDFAYRLTIRDASPDYQLAAEPANPNIPRGGSVPLTVSANRLLGYEGPIDIRVEGLPDAVTASSSTIPEGQNSTVLLLTASSEASPGRPPVPIKIAGHARVNGHDLVRVANQEAPLQLVSVIPAPDVVITAGPKQVALEPGKETTVTLHIERQNAFKGRVPCYVRNLPPGVRVVNVGLNGVLVTEAQSSRTFTLRAEDWAQPISQPIYVVAEVESNSPTMHASPAVLLRVEGKKEIVRSGTNPRHTSPGAREGSPRRR